MVPLMDIELIRSDMMSNQKQVEGEDAATPIFYAVVSSFFIL